MKYLKLKMVKDYCKNNGKQVSTEALDMLDRRVEDILSNAIKNIKHLKKITTADILNG